METTIAPSDNDDWIQYAAEVFASGGLVAFPTDTVYGLGADPFQPDAVVKIYQVKKRPADKSIPVLLGAREDLSKVVRKVPAAAAKLMQAFWPGALTLVLEKQPAIPTVVSSTHTIGVRIPDHQIAQQLLRSVGPLAVTSANLSGEPEANEATQVLDQIGGSFDLLIDAGRTAGARPSTVVDCTIQPVVIIREGPVSREEIFSFLEST